MMKRLICGHQFVLIAAIEPERDGQGKVREFNPRRTDGQELSDAPFCRFAFPTDKRRPGVYAVFVNDRVMYIGKTNNLSPRFGPGEYGHIVVPEPGNPQVTNRRVNHGILEAARRGDIVQVWFNPTSDRDAIEATLIGRLHPPWNRETPENETDSQPVSSETARSRWPPAMRGAEKAKATLIKDRTRGERMFAKLLIAYPDDGWPFFKRAEAYEHIGSYREPAADYARAEGLLPFPGRKAEAHAALLRTRSNEQVSFDVVGLPATFVTAGEKTWKNLLAVAIPAPSMGGREVGLTARFVVPTLAPSGHPLDIDNLCEPLFSILINRTGWFGGARPNIMWWSASKEEGTQCGCRIAVSSDPTPSLDKRVPLIEGTYAGPWPRSATAPEVAEWSRSILRAHEHFAPTAAFSCYLGFGPDQINISDVATGVVKSFIDCLYPILGGSAGNPSDHRIDELTVAKAVQGVAADAVLLKFWALERVVSANNSTPTKPGTRL